jgi:hypothetical protein
MAVAAVVMALPVGNGHPHAQMSVSGEKQSVLSPGHWVRKGLILHSQLGTATVQ